MEFLRKYLGGIFIILYSVGILGFRIPALQSLFLTLIPGFLLLTAILLLASHASWNLRFGFWAIMTFTFGWTIEWIGVHTGQIFGNYAYGATLGWKVDGIPLVIGINWLILAYCCKDIAERIFKHPVVSILMASALMTGLDFLIEPVAMRYDYWQWENNQVPLHNYVGWFLVSVVLFSLSHLFRLKWENRASVILYLCMLGFFVSLNF
ncbi:MAG: carotenoid biosynthesis protein [Bacteroidota bacterium]|nr:carotenoid biosynthesis protein [Bacteroidota bacterium]MDX5430518.1 carotenoid biosynthesis protein [Bacteroidota bacterium]MDX5469271.1 carotenoid biosynthesis protein [Bacteroidota bacterium]